jgi:hypothetical protein
MEDKVTKVVEDVRHATQLAKSAQGVYTPLKKEVVRLTAKVP